MSSTMVSTAGGRCFCMAASHAGAAPRRASIRDARRRIAVADEDEPAFEPSFEVRFSLVAVRHIQQLHHVGAVFPLAGERARDFLADRGAVVRKRDQPRLAAILLEAVAQ